jgi:hypothetical protein
MVESCTPPKWYDNTHHPIWKLLRTALVCGVLTIFLALNYNKFDSRDLMTIFATGCGLLGFDHLKTKITGRKPDNAEDDKPSDSSDS